MTLTTDPVLQRSLAEASLTDALEFGLSEEEWHRLLELLGRTPNRTEAAIVASMWSEHCSYKSSRLHLAKLPSEGPQVLQGPGENAGIVDLGDGLACAFKVESHNHPSFIEPYEGAATGVGGILRDIFTMGARPVALLDGLRFGRPEAPRMRHLVDGVVRGIGDYGNCIGVPNLGGEVDFHQAYDSNILVNAMCVGVLPADAIFRGTAGHPGCAVVYLGSATGADGIHGATMASDVFEDDEEASRPTVQVGDAFTEKKLLECSLALMRERLCEGIQDMGAAGLTSSSFEMAQRSGLGMQLELDRVPMRASGLGPYELMLSESQERMLLAVEPAKVAAVIALAERWELEAMVIGEVTDSGRIVAHWYGEPAFDLEVEPLVEAAPKLDRPYLEPEPKTGIMPSAEALAERDLGVDLETLLARPELGSSSWITEQYDQSVGTDTVIGCGADAGLLRLKGTDKGLAVTLDCNALACSIDPELGAAMAVTEAAFNLACVGARALGTTDCLNFASPERPEIMGQIVASIDGMAAACRAFDAPVVSGNVSLYNETSGRGVLPTPAIGMVGLVEPLIRRPRISVLAGERIFLAGPGVPGLGGSRWLQVCGGAEHGPLAELDLERAAAFARDLADAVRDLEIAAHDLSLGGLALALVEMGESSGIAVDLSSLGLEATQAVFGEAPALVIVAASEELADELTGRLGSHGLVELGRAEGDRLQLRNDDVLVVDRPMAELRRRRALAFSSMMEG